MPDIGRFFNIDPMARAFYYNSPYAFSENKVTTHREMEGLEAFFIHGTLSDNSMWKEDLVEFIMSELKPYFTTDQSVDTEFKWNGVSAQPTPPQLLFGGRKMNWLLNTGKRDRAAAARMLVAYIMKKRVNGQLITLVGHSHGGNVAIQAARMLSKKHGISVNVVNFNTPAWNGPNDPENPLNDSDINELLHFFTDGDAVAGPVAGDDYYHGAPMPNNIRQIMLFNPLKKSSSGYEQHVFDNINWMEVFSRFRASNQESSKSGNKKKEPDADSEACKRSGGC